MKLIVIIFIAMASVPALAKSITTNHYVIHSAPKWLTRGKAERVSDRIQQYLEWRIRKVNIYYYDTVEAFTASHSLGARARAVTRKSAGQTTVHLGPQVTEKNFAEIFGHELVHVVFFQKHKSAIPRWLEEGFASYLSQKKTPVNYKWLAKRSFPEDIKSMSHPFRGSNEGITYHYLASQAVVEMIARKCDLNNLLRLSVGKGVETFLQTTCRIKDINGDFRQWVNKKARLTF